MCTTHIQKCSNNINYSTRGLLKNYQKRVYITIFILIIANDIRIKIRLPNPQTKFNYFSVIMTHESFMFMIIILTTIFLFSQAPSTSFSSGRQPISGYDIKVYNYKYKRVFVKLNLQI